MDYQLTTQEIEYVALNSNVYASDWLRLLDIAINTIAEGIFIAGKQKGFAETMICDDEWNEFPLAIIASKNTKVMPHMVEIDGEFYNADYAVRVLATYIASVNHVRETATVLDRVASFC